MIEELYRHHYKYLFMVAYNICKRWDMDEDLVQDGFYKILHSKENFTDIHDARKYLCGCIRYAAFERLGRERRGAAMVRDFVEVEPTSVEHVAISLYKIKSVVIRTILKEIYFHNRSRREVAKEYSISREAVRQAEEKGLNELRKIYALELGHIK